MFFWYSTDVKTCWSHFPFSSSNFPRSTVKGQKVKYLCTWKNIKLQGRQVNYIAAVVFIAHKRITIGRVSFETYFTEQIQVILECFEIRTSKFAEKFGLFQHNLKSTGITIEIGNHESIKQITNSELLILKSINSRFSWKAKSSQANFVNQVELVLRH
jgi:hypothetical protein